MNRRTTWILVGLAALLLAYIWYSGRPRGNAAAGTETPSVPTPIPGSGSLFNTTSEQITGMWVMDMAAKSSVELSKDAQGNWQVTSPEARPADPTQAQTFASQFANVYVSTVITTATDLTPFGVLGPTYTLGVKLVDGSNLRVSVGDKAPTGSGYYILRDGESNAVVVSTSAIDGLVALLKSPPYATSTATPTPTVDLTALTPTVVATGTPVPTDVYEAATPSPAPTQSASATP